MNSDRLARALFEEHPDPCWIREPDSLRIVAINDAAVRRYGHSREEFLEMTTRELESADGGPQIPAATEMELDGQLRWHTKKNGDLVLVELVVRSVPYAGNEAELVLARDVGRFASPEMVQAVRDASDDWLTLRAAQRLLGIGTWAMDLSTRQLSWAPETYAIYGRGEGDFGGSYDEYVALVHPDDRAEMQQRAEEFIAAGTGTFTYAHRIVTSSGAIRHVEGAAELVVDDGVRRVAGVVQDVTEIHETQKELQRLARALQVAGRVAKFGSWRVELTGDGSWQVKWSDQTAAIHGAPAGFSPTVEAALAYYIPEHQPVIEQAFARCISEGVPFDETLQIEPRGGERIWVRTVGEAERNERGHIVAVRGAFQDITTWKETEAELRSREQQYRALVEGAPIGIFKTRTDGTLISANPALARMLGFASSDAAQEYYDDVGEQVYRDPRVRRAFLADLDAQGQVTGFEFEAVTRDGSPLWLNMNARVAERLADGSFTMEGFIFDETDRKRAEEKRRRSDQLLNFCGRMAQIGGWEYALRSQSAYLTEEAYRIYELPLDRELPVEEGIQYYDPEDRPRVESAFRRAIEDAEPYELEVRFISANGNRKWIETMGMPQLVDGDVVSIIGSIQDITQRKEREIERVRLAEQLMQAQKMESVGRLAGGIAHDFNNLLTVINSYADFVAEDLPASDPRRADVEQIKIAGLRAADLTRQLLAFSRKQVLEPTAINLNDVVIGVDKMLGRLIGEDIDVSTSLADDLGCVLADPGQIEQVLINLAVNARDAMPNGGHLTIETAEVDLDEEYASTNPGIVAGPHIMLAVTDDGMGMSPETQQRVFEPFFTTKATGEGTGLGLATVYGIIKQSRGTIYLYSRLGRGTTFKIYLPRVDGEAASESAPASDFVTQGSETVLLVEDEDGVRALAQRILTSKGYRVIAAADPAEALLKYERHRDGLDLVLTDVIMPHMNGRELVDRLTGDNPGLKAIFMSGYTDNAVLRQGILEPGTHFIGKPFSARSLLAKVRTVLDAD